MPGIVWDWLGQRLAGTFQSVLGTFLVLGCFLLPGTFSSLVHSHPWYNPNSWYILIPGTVPSQTQTPETKAASDGHPPFGIPLPLTFSHALSLMSDHAPPTDPRLPKRRKAEAETDPQPLVSQETPVSVSAQAPTTLDHLHRQIHAQSEVLLSILPYASTDDSGSW